MRFIRFSLLLAAIIVTGVVLARHNRSHAIPFTPPPDIPSSTKIVEPDGTAATIHDALAGITTTLASFRKETTDAYRELRNDLDELSKEVDRVALAQAPQPKKVEPEPDPEFSELADDPVTTPEIEKDSGKTARDDETADENVISVTTSKIANSPPVKCCPDCLCKPAPCHCDHPGACIEAWAKANGLARVHFKHPTLINRYGAEAGKGVLLTPDGHHYRSEWLPGSYQRTYVPQRISGGCASGQCSRGMGSY